MFDYRNLIYCHLVIRAKSRRMYRMLWVKCATPAGCKSIRIAMSVVMDGWNGRFLAVLALSEKVFYDKKEWQTGNWVPQRYARRGDDLWATMGWPEKEKHGSPQPSSVTKINLFDRCFQQGYRDSISTRETIFKTLSFSTKI